MRRKTKSESVSPMRRKSLKSNQANNLVEFPPMRRKQGGGNAVSPMRREAWLKNLLPPQKRGRGWWVVKKDGSGFKLQFRWNVQEKTDHQYFARIGANELANLM